MKKVISAKGAPEAIGPYSQAIECNGFLYVSGQIPTDKGTGQFVPGGMKEQTEQVFRNINYILEEAGYSFGDIIKTTVYLADMDDFGIMNEVYATFFTEPYPARAAFAVKSLPKGALIEIDIVASK